MSGVFRVFRFRRLLNKLLNKLLVKLHLRKARSEQQWPSPSLFTPEFKRILEKQLPFLKMCQPVIMPDNRPIASLMGYPVISKTITFNLYRCNPLPANINSNEYEK